MMTISKLRLLLFILPFWSSGSNGNKVEIIETGLRAEDGSFECGESIVLTCIITDFSQYMLWQNDSSKTPLAQCELGVCLFDEQSESIFEFTHDTSLAVFNLTIFQTTLVNDGATYRCVDITTGNFSSSTITVSDYLPITLEENADNLTVTSGCIDPGVKVNIVWFKVKSDTGEGSEYNPTTIVVRDNEVVCATENICSLSTYIQITTTISIKQDGNEAYKLKAVLFYNGERKESNTTNTVYMIKEQEAPNRQTDNTGLDVKIKVISAVSSVVGFFFVVGGCCLIYKCISGTSVVSSHRGRDDDDIMNGKRMHKPRKTILGNKKDLPTQVVTKGSKEQNKTDTDVVADKDRVITIIEVSSKNPIFDMELPSALKKKQGNIPALHKKERKISGKKVNGAGKKKKNTVKSTPKNITETTSKNIEDRNTEKGGNTIPLCEIENTNGEGKVNDKKVIDAKTKMDTHDRTSSKTHETNTKKPGDSHNEKDDDKAVNVREKEDTNDKRVSKDSSKKFSDAKKENDADDRTPESIHETNTKKAAVSHTEKDNGKTIKGEN